MHDDLLLLILSSPSGAGKTTLTHRLRQDFPDLGFSVSHTTRKPRQNEVHGKDYHFVSVDRFQEMVKAQQFAEWAEVHGNYYGTADQEIEKACREGKHALLFDVDYQGARQIRAKYPHDAVGVFILPPSMEELHRRLVSRGTDDDETIQRRFSKARQEIEQYPFFDYLLVNDDLDESLARLKGIVHAERSRRWRMARAAEALLKR